MAIDCHSSLCLEDYTFDFLGTFSPLGSMVTASCFK